MSRDTRPVRKVAFTPEEKRAVEQYVTKVRPGAFDEYYKKRPNRKVRQIKRRAEQRETRERERELKK